MSNIKSYKVSVIVRINEDDKSNKDLVHELLCLTLLENIDIYTQVADIQPADQWQEVPTQDEGSYFTS